MLPEVLWSSRVRVTWSLADSHGEWGGVHHCHSLSLLSFLHIQNKVVGYQRFYAFCSNFHSSSKTKIVTTGSVQEDPVQLIDVYLVAHAFNPVLRRHK